MVSRAYNLEGFVRMLDSWGLTDVMLPFLLIFTIVFAILQKTKILGEGKKNFNVVISLVMGLLVVIPHVTRSYPANADVVDMINRALPSVSIIIVAIIMLLLLVGLFGGEAKWGGSSLSGWVAIIAFIVILAIFGSAAGWWTGWNWFTRFFGSDAIALIIIILVFGIIIAFITGGGEEKNKETIFRRIGEDVGKFFGGK